MSTPEFPTALVERCCNAIPAPPRTFEDTVEAILAESGHKELVEALKLVRGIIGEAAPLGFNPLAGDWAERLYRSQGDTLAALRKAGAR